MWQQEILTDRLGWMQWLRRLRYVAPLALLLVTCAARASAGGIKITGPVIEITPPVFDFGTLPQESLRKVTTWIRNDGTEPLRIHGITSDCGCTVAQLSDSTLAPGDSTKLRITFSTRHFSGAITKHIRLLTNDPAAPKAPIKLKAVVRAIVSLQPPSVDFGSVPRGESPARTITIKAAASDSLRIQDVLVPEETFETRIHNAGSGDSTAYSLEIMIRPDAPVGPFSSTARIQTNIRNARTLSLNLKGQIHGFFKAQPCRLLLGQVRQGRVRQRSIQLVAQHPGAHRVIGASCSGENLQVHVTPIEEGRIYEITVTVPPTMHPGRVHAMLNIQTDDPDQPEIRIPVQGNVRRARSEGK